ncbi:hypothetical protein BGX34_009296 [Mortierella sp. NVP85]|nr:hypothetical protein BGX34_009296 [Mortierella sp. NVP85]
MTVTTVEALDLSVPVEDYQSLDLDTFYRRYGYPRQPVMLQNSGVETWPAWEQWTLDALAAKYGDNSFRVSNIDSDTVPTFDLCLKDFLHYVRCNRDQDPLYLFDPRFVEAVPEMESAYEVPKYFEVDFFSLLEKDTRPPYRWLLIGPQRTGASWHTDPSGTSAWNTLLSGHKRWALYPPHIVPPGHNPSSSKRLSSVEWYLDVYPFLSPELRPKEIVQYPGQTIYVPSGWWHMVLNMDDTVAVTQNFADETNLPLVKQALLEDTKERTQIRRWKLLEEKLPKVRPDLGPAIRLSPEEKLLEPLKQQGSWLDPDSLDTAVKWQERARDVLARSIGGANPEKITPIKSGKNVFFTPFQDGYSCFLSEVQTNLTLMATSEKRIHGDILSFPKMLGHGYLLDTDEKEPSKWRWPYIVTENVHSGGHQSHPPGQLFGTGLDYYDSDEDYEYQSVIPLVMRTLKHLHTLDIQNAQILQDGHKEQAINITRRIAEAVENHIRWRAFPKHLLESLSSYLPINSEQLFDPANGDTAASIVHGDVNLENILGYRRSIEADCPSSNGSSPDSHDDLSAQTEGSGYTFTPTTLIDFGDATFLGDPLVDIVSVFIAILDCQREPELTKYLLDYWRDWTKGKDHSNTRTTLARRCMWHMLLWPSNGLSHHLAQCVSGIGEMSTWEQVEEAVFGWWSQL